MKNDSSNLLITASVLLLGAAIARAGSSGSASAGGVSVFALIVALAFLVQIVAFVPSYVAQSERFFDITGSLTYIALTVGVAALAAPLDGRSVLLVSLVLIWAARLGTFLFRRVLKSGRDSRFDELKPSFLRFLNVWVLQGLWITITAGAAWGAIASAHRVPMDSLAIVGLVVWLIGFTIEVIADLQKNRFRADLANKGRFISSGLWSWSRHPNYFGEIMLWLGVALIAFPTLQGWQLLTLISPVFVFLLITRVSGIPLLEAHADEKWGGQEDYEEYKTRTSVLLPLPPQK